MTTTPVPPAAPDTEAPSSGVAADTTAKKPSLEPPAMTEAQRVAFQNTAQIFAASERQLELLAQYFQHQKATQAPLSTATFDKFMALPPIAGEPTMVEAGKSVRQLLQKVESLQVANGSPSEPEPEAGTAGKSNDPRRAAMVAKAKAAAEGEPDGAAKARAVPPTLNQNTYNGTGIGTITELVKAPFRFAGKSLSGIAGAGAALANAAYEGTTVPDRLRERSVAKWVDGQRTADDAVAGYETAAKQFAALPATATASERTAGLERMQAALDNSQAALGDERRAIMTAVRKGTMTPDEAQEQGADRISRMSNALERAQNSDAGNDPDAKTQLAQQQKTLADAARQFVESLRRLIANLFSKNKAAAPA